MLFLSGILQQFLPDIRGIHGRQVRRSNVKQRLAAEDLTAVHPDHRPGAGHQHGSGEFRVGLQLQGELHHMLMLRQIKLSKFILNLSELYSILFHHFSYSNTISKRFKNLKMPILLFHGGKDDYVPTENINLNYDVVPEGIYKEKHIFEDSVHTKCVVDHKQEYKEIVDNFVNKYIK